MSEDPGVSVFMDQDEMPNAPGLEFHLGKTFVHWQQLRDYVYEKYPRAEDLWSYYSKKYGWSYRIKDKKRAIIYLSPREGYFLTTMIFGPRALEHIYASDFDPWIKKTLEEGKKYPEGKVIRIQVKDDTWVKKKKKLITVKLAF